MKRKPYFTTLILIGIFCFLAGCSTRWYARGQDVEALDQQVQAAIEKVPGVVSADADLGVTGGGLDSSWDIEVETNAAEAKLTDMQEPVFRAITEVLAPIGRNPRVDVTLTDPNGVRDISIGHVREWAKRYGIKYGK